MSEQVIKNDFNSAEYKRSRGAYMVQCTFEYFVTLLVADAFLAKLLTSIGISDSLIGIISSFITMAFVIQLMSIFLVRAKVSSKRLSIVFYTLSNLFFMSLYLIPFMPFGVGTKTVLVMLCILFAYAGTYLVASICFKWANSYVEPTKRADYSATKEMISLVTGIVFTAVIGYVIDKYESIGNLNGGFLFIAIALLIINICNFISLLLIKKDSPEDHKSDNKPLKEVVKYTLGNKNFRNVIILTVLWDVARYFTIGFMGTFKTNDLLISVFAVQLINMIANAARIVISKPMGRYSDKHSFASGFKLALYLAGAAFFINMFTTRTTWYFIIAYTVLFSMSTAGTNQNSFNITYSYVDSAYIPQAMAFKNSIGGIFGFLASFAGSRLLGFIQSRDNMIFGMHIYGQQILSAISLIFIIICIIFISKVIEKQKVKIQ